MKKIALLIAVAALSLSADTIIQSINVGANASTLNSKSGTGWNVGYGGSKYYDNGILFGVDFNYDSIEIDGIKNEGMGSDVKIGYSYNKKIGVYAIGTGTYFNEDVGFGYGAGIEYLPFKHLGVAIDYKTISMQSQANNYDLDTVKAYLKIMF